MRKCVLLSLLCCILSGPVLAQLELPSPEARLRVIADKSELVYGESIRLIVTYEVDDGNRVPLQFHDPASYLTDMLKRIEPIGFIQSESIEELMGERAVNEQGEPTTRYNFFDAVIKPYRTGKIIIPSMHIDMVWYTREQLDDPNKDFKAKKLLPQDSEPVHLVINPNPLFPDATSPPLIGDYTFEDKLAPGSYAVGDTIDYEFTVSGNNHTIDIQLPKPGPDSYRILTRHIEYSDSSKNNSRPGAEKRYLLSLVPLKPGEIKLGDYFRWEYSPAQGESISQFRSSKTLTVGKNWMYKESHPSLDIMLAVDISESMNIEDYSPTRKGKAVQLAAAYKERFADGRVMAFAGSTLDLSGPGFLPRMLEDFKIKELGTALGNMVWLGTETLNAQAPKKVIIIIGDGDNTAGNVSILQASFFAKNHGVRIYTIGIGTAGEVPFGKDFFGRPQYVDNTFSSVTLQKLAELTGGKYYHLGKEDSTEDLIRTIKKEIESY